MSEHDDMDETYWKSIDEYEGEEFSILDINFSFTKKLRTFGTIGIRIPIVTEDEVE